MLLIAALTGIQAWALLRLRAESSRSAAALSAVSYGIRLSHQLAQIPILKQPVMDPEALAYFRRLVESLEQIEPDVDQISLIDDGVVIFQKRQLDALTPPALKADAGRVTIRKEKLAVGTTLRPVLTVVRQTRNPAGTVRELRISLDKERIEQRFPDAVPELPGFSYAFATVAGSFLLCLLTTLWLLRREMTRQRQQRMDEHLAFAGAMAGGLLHDFRNPMSAIKLDAQLLQSEAAKPEGGRPERMIELAGRIDSTLNRIDHLLQEFLVLSKPDPARRARMELNACVADCAELLKLRFERASLALQVTMTPEPLYGLGHPGQFKRALLNLLNNAEHFAPTHSTVQVSLRAERGAAILDVMDEGPGIPAARRETVFEMFHSTRPGGTGLGLALARTAIEHCGGTLRAIAPPKGKGACFRIEIPVI